MLKKFKGVLAAVMIITSFCGNAYAETVPEGENVAFGKNTAAGSEHQLGWYPAANMVDGKFSDNGVDSNKWTTSEGAEPADTWIRVDLGKAYSINAIVTEAWHDTNYSSGAVGTITASKTEDFAESVELGTIEFVAGKQTIEVDTSEKWRYIKIKGSCFAGRRWGIWELEVYSTDKVVAHGENVALRKQVTANSVHHLNWYPAAALTNGVKSGEMNQWRSDYGTSNGQEVYAIVDLGKEYNINAVQGLILTGVESAGQKATVAVSNNQEDWETVGEFAYSDKEQILEVDDINKWRYVKVSSTVIPGRWFGMWELEVYSDLPQLLLITSKDDETPVTGAPADGEMAVKIDLKGFGANCMLAQAEYIDGVLETVNVYKKTVAGSRIIPVSGVTPNTVFTLWAADTGLQITDAVSLTE